MKIFCDFSSKEQKIKLYEDLKKLEPVRYLIEIKRDRPKRSNQQSRYYWGVVIRMISDMTGFTPDETHEVLKVKYLEYFKALPTGEEVRLTRSTTDLDTYEFEMYLEHIRQFAAQDLDLVIPLPNEVLEI